MIYLGEVIIANQRKNSRYVLSYLIALFIHVIVIVIVIAIAIVIIIALIESTSNVSYLSSIELFVAVESITSGNAIFRIKTIIIALGK